MEAAIPAEKLLTLNALSIPLDASEAPDFHLLDFADPTLLVPGTQTSILWLAHAFASDRPFVLRQSSSQGTGSLTIQPTDRDTGAMIESGGHYRWDISRQEARQCYELLLSLAGSERPSHQYLDPDANATDHQIVVSLGEFEDISQKLMSAH